MKTCTCCNETKPKTEFYGDNKSHDLKRRKCKLCDKKTNSKWREENADHARALVYTWRKNNPDKFHAINAKSREKNFDRVSVSNGCRRASEKRATPSWASKLAMREFYALSKKLSEESGEKHNVDHIVPLNNKLVCGLHCEANMQVISSAENFAKNNFYWPDMPDRE